MTPRFAALRSRNFRLFWIGFLISHTGTWMAFVGVGWLIYSLTKSPLYLGINSLAFALPMVVLPIFGGVVADRVDRIRLMLVTQSGMFLDALVMAVMVQAGYTLVWALIALNFLEGVFLAFDNPTRHALIPELVDPSALVSAVSLASVSYSSTAFVGPALAGLILGKIGTEQIHVLFYLNALSFLAVVMSLLLLRDVPRHARHIATGVLHSLGDGLRYTWSTPVTRNLVLLALIAGLFSRSYSALMPVFALDVLRVGARGLGFLMAAPGAGTIVGSLILASAREVPRKGRFYVAGNLIFCASLTTLALSRNFLLSLGVLFVGGAFAATSNVVQITMLQFNAPPHLRGRVLSMATLASIGVPSLGGMVVASAATGIGAPFAILGGALVVATAMVALGATTLWRAA